MSEQGTNPMPVTTWWYVCPNCGRAFAKWHNCAQAVRVFIPGTTAAARLDGSSE